MTLYEYLTLVDINYDNIFCCENILKCKRFKKMKDLY